MNIKKVALIFIYFLGTSTVIFAQAPGWKVIESSYQYTMTLQAKLNVDGIQLSNQNDLVGAFVGSSCRGVTGLTYVAGAKMYYAYLTIFSNTPNEVITFNIYNSTTNKITKVSKTINFIANQHIGNLFQSYSIAEPTLSDKASILTFDFLNIKSLSSSITPGSIKVSISESFPLNSLTPVFSLSKGANLFKNRIIQTTGSIAINFNAAVNYEVLSEDESTLTNYTVNVTQAQDLPLFYKKDAVCSTLGAIKVVSKREGTAVQLSLNGKLIDSKSITNGEAIFLNLVTGTYVANIGNDYKVIIINLKGK
jgi:hypothetical protein